MRPQELRDAAQTHKALGSWSLEHARLNTQHQQSGTCIELSAQSQLGSISEQKGD